MIAYQKETKFFIFDSPLNPLSPHFSLTTFFFPDRNVIFFYLIT